jgi:hypothetical protein
MLIGITILTHQKSNTSFQKGSQKVKLTILNHSFKADGSATAGLQRWEEPDFTCQLAQAGIQRLHAKGAGFLLGQE